jgi:pimeloyl-ACP methyl ester carboxylesterase
MSNLNYRELGNGPAVVLIHGFPMNQQVWNDLAEKLSEAHHVITLDLPGFGKSPALKPGFTLENVAHEVAEWVRERKYEQPVIVGHSLGGYVSLAMIEEDPAMAGGVCLFHSTALADSEEKKHSRNKVMDFIRKQGAHAFTSNFIGQLYADPQHSSITRVKNIAVQSSREAVEGYTLAMRDRKDRTHVVRSFHRPMLFLAGEKDQGIPPQTIQQQAASAPNAEVVILPDVAHMGMFESEATCVKKIKSFVAKCTVTFPGAKG